MSEATASDSIRILCVDDHPLLREGIATLIASQGDMRVVGDAASGRDAIIKFREHRPDVTLMDLRLPDMSGIDVLIAIRSEFADARIVMLTTFDGDVEIRRGLEAGARGYLLKSIAPQNLLEGIRSVHAGYRYIPAQISSSLTEHMGEESLTTREVEVLREIAQGNRNQDIGRHLFISEATVKVHVKHIMEKLKAADRTEAVTLAIRRGIIQL